MNHEKVYTKHKEASDNLEQLDQSGNTGVLHAIKKAKAQLTYETNLRHANLGVKSAELEAHAENDERKRNEEQDLIAFSWKRGPVAADKLTDEIYESGLNTVEALDSLFEKIEQLDDKSTLPEYMTYKDGSVIVNGVYSDSEWPGYIGASGINYLISGVRQAQITKTDTGYSVDVFETANKKGNNQSSTRRGFVNDLREKLLRYPSFTDYARYAALLDQSTIEPIGEPILSADITTEFAGSSSGVDGGKYFDSKIFRILHGEMPRKYISSHQALNVGIL